MGAMDKTIFYVFYRIPFCSSHQYNFGPQQESNSFLPNHVSESVMCIENNGWTKYTNLLKKLMQSVSMYVQQKLKMSCGELNIDIF
jgi:hypothetical protein